MKRHQYAGLFESMLQHGARFKSVFNPPTPKNIVTKAPPPPPEAPLPDDAGIKRAKKRKTAQRLSATGSRLSTILSQNGTNEKLGG